MINIFTAWFVFAFIVIGWFALFVHKIIKEYWDYKFRMRRLGISDVDAVKHELETRLDKQKEYIESLEERIKILENEIF